MVDDLRPDLVAYGQNFTHNPSISKLAASGLVFDQAYVFACPTFTFDIVNCNQVFIELAASVLPLATVCCFHQIGVALAHVGVFHPFVDVRDAGSIKSYCFNSQTVCCLKQSFNS